MGQKIASIRSYAKAMPAAAVTAPEVKTIGDKHLSPQASFFAMQEIEEVKKEASEAKQLAKDGLLFGLAMSLDFAAIKFANKDRNTTGVDDAIAAELGAFALKVRKFQLTGIWEATPAA